MVSIAGRNWGIRVVLNPAEARINHAPSFDQGPRSTPSRQARTDRPWAIGIGAAERAKKRSPGYGRASSRARRQLDWFHDRRIIILRLVYPSRYRPHPHQLGRERPHQVAGIGLIA